LGTNTDESVGSAGAGGADGHRHPFRGFFARNRTLDLTYRIVIGVVGGAIVVGGIALIPLPGPGWLIVFAGLAVLATEFAWAQRLLDFAKDKVRAWTDWMTEQSVLVRAAVGLGGLLVVGAVLWLAVQVWGVPAWVPGWVPLV
jgi:uncharacterized protein (TIGR02611 family)